jgi:hypothetical protein
MSDRQEPVLSRCVEHGLEILRRMSYLGGIEPDTNDPLFVRQRAM